MGSIKCPGILILLIGGVLGLCLCVMVAVVFFGDVDEPQVAGVPDTVADTGVPDQTDAEPPTNIPEPTAIPVPTQAPIFLSGSGDSVVNVAKSDAPMLIHITGNSAGRHFAVKNLDASGESIDLLVNTTDPYVGIRPLDFRDGEHTMRLEITATGSWEIEIRPLESARALDVPGTISGNGDEVIRLVGSMADLAIIVGNAGSRHFAVLSYGSSGVDLLVNTTDVYSGQ